jgi:hypothetical protein
MAAEAMHHDRASWVVTDFNLNDWNIENSSVFIGGREYVCDAAALFRL